LKWHDWSLEEAATMAWPGPPLPLPLLPPRLIVMAFASATRRCRGGVSFFVQSGAWSSYHFMSLNLIIYHLMNSVYVLACTSLFQKRRWCGGGGPDYDCGGGMRPVGPAAAVGTWRIVMMLGVLDPKGLVYGI